MVAGSRGRDNGKERAGRSFFVAVEQFCLDGGGDYMN